jgi:hypothetical protein
MKTGLEDLSVAPGIRLREGLEETYRWIHDQIVSVNRNRAVKEPTPVPIG